MTELTTDKKAVVLCRLVMATMFVALCYRWAIQTLPYQFLDPPLFSLALELPYRLFKFLGLYELLVSNKIGSIIFSAILLIAAFFGMIFPRKHGLIITFAVLFLFYLISYNTAVIVHVHPLSMMVWITVPFCFRRPVNQILWWDALRFYAIFIYVVSFLLKVTGGSFFVWQNGLHSVKWNIADYLYYSPDTLAAGVLRFGITHPFFLNAGHTAILLLEGIMAIGFFTRKYDRWLLWVPVIIHGATYLFSDVFFFEMLVVTYLFLDNRQIEYINKKIPVMSK